MGAQSKGLQAEAEKYRRLIEQASDAILGIDPEDGSVVGANPKALEMTGFTLEEIQARHVWELHPESEHAAARALFERVRETGEGAAEDMHLCTKAGAQVDVDITASLISYPGGRVIQRICRDTSDRHARERERQWHRAFTDLVLSISAEFNRLSADEIPDAIDAALERIGEFTAVDRAYFYVLESDTMSRVHVWTGEPLEVREAWMPEDRRVPLETFAQGLAVLRKGETLEYQVIEDPAEGAPPREGDPYTRWSIMLPVMGATDLEGFIGLDILRARRDWDANTKELLRIVGSIFGGAWQRKAASEALSRSHDELEEKVEARTRELREKQAQLVQTEKMASLGQLVAGVAHELNTPLGALKSTLQTLDRSVSRLEDGKTDPARIARVLGPLSSAGSTAVDRIDQIVRSLRTFAHLDRAAVDEVDLLEGLESTLTLAQPQTADRITIRRHFEPLPAVRCHPGQINQVFMNVLLNAIQAIDGEGTIDVNAAPDEHGVRVLIQDSGRGISADHLARIFDPGFTTKGVGVGTGLGLSIAHQIVTEHEGRIEVRSTVGEGTTVDIWLPEQHDHTHSA